MLKEVLTAYINAQATRSIKIKELLGSQSLEVNEGINRRGIQTRGSMKTLGDTGFEQSNVFQFHFSIKSICNTPILRM